MKDITLLIAHPDDEAIFLWPFLDRVKRIVCASNDAFNPEREWCKERGLCLAEVGKLLGCEIICEPNNSEFYRQDTRSGNLKNSCERIMKYLHGAEIIATHNAWGCYGHIDHVLCHHIARTHQARHGGQLLVTDIAMEINWLPVTAWDQVHDAEYDGPTHHELDRELFNRIRAIYDSRGCWTWADSLGIVDKCKVLSI